MAGDKSLDSLEKRKTWRKKLVVTISATSIILGCVAYGTNHLSILPRVDWERTWVSGSRPKQFGREPAGIESRDQIELTRYGDCFKAYFSAALSFKPEIISINLSGVKEKLPQVFTTALQRSTPYTPIRSLLKPVYGKLSSSYRVAGKVEASKPLDFLRDNQVYNFVITDSTLEFSPKGKSFAENQISKHYMLNHLGDSVRYAGSLWKDVNGELHIRNDSGTYRLQTDFVHQAAELLKENFKLSVVHAHGFGTPQDVDPFKAVKSLNGAKVSEVSELEDDDSLWRDLDLARMNVSSNNEIYQATRSDGTVVAVFKKAGMTKKINGLLNNWDLLTGAQLMESGGLTKRSVVTYDISKELGFEIVPKTVPAALRQEVDSQASLQEFLPARYKIGKEAPKAWIEKVDRVKSQQMYLLDTLLGMADRHNRNWMVDATGDLKLIDTDHILYNAANTRWQSTTPIETYFPRAMGSIERSITERFLALTPERLSAILRAREINEDAIAFATLRLKGIQQALLADAPLEQIVGDYRILAKLNYLNVGGAALAFGLGSYAIVSELCQKQPSRKTSSVCEVFQNK